MTRLKKGRRKHLLASKVKYIISNSLWSGEYERISNCSIVKEIWDTLKIAHVSTTHVNTFKVHTLVSQYELFKMNDGESIKKHGLKIYYYCKSP